ncbi:MAG: ABC transporter substrate-binding protein [Methylophilus sp.]|nr:ABC transporter substrate-binding protein [Methylophilus sp.]
MRKFYVYCLLALLSACTQHHQTTEIRFAIAQAPLNLDPRYATDAASERVNRLLYQRLVEFDASSKVIPGLADWQALSPQRYRLTLKQNTAPFHHGKALNADDVKATYDSLLALKDSPHVAEYRNIAAIQVIDSRTLMFELKAADTHFPEKLIIGILPNDLIVKGYDFSHAPIGNGRLKFVRWQGALVLQHVNSGKKVILTEVKDPTVRVLKLLHGEADLLQGDLPPELVKYLQSKPEIHVNTGQGANFSYLGLNMQDPVLKQLKVRQALAYAIDRQAIIDKVMVENTHIAGAILPPEHYAGNATLQPYTYQPALAKQLLQEAGFQLPLKLVYKTSTDAQRVRFATILQAQMAPAGIDLEIRSLDWGTFFEDVKQGKFQLFGLTWVGIKTPEIYAKAFGSAYVPPNGFNRGRYIDAELDALLQNEDWQAATQRIHAQLPYIPLWYEGQFVAYRTHIKGYMPAVDGNWDSLADVN